MNHGELVSELVALRKEWTIQDFKDAYGDLESEPGSREWEVVPETLAECFEKMEEHLFHCYTSNFIQECIEDEA